MRVICAVSKIKIIEILSLLFFIVSFTVVSQTKIVNIGQQVLKNDQKLTVINYQSLLNIKERLNTSKYRELYVKLLKQADTALTDKNFSVTYKSQTPQSGDKHDYSSIGPYWWPDNTQPGGLPWIRKDGEINPEFHHSNTDHHQKSKMFQNTHNLALAYFFSDEKKYAMKGLELLRVWFVEDATKMNPNLNFAQAIPGINTGRGIGIIDFAGITNIITAIEIYEMNNLIDSTLNKKLNLWFTEYLQWLQTSKFGLVEKNTKNNHAVWYDVQVSSILIFLNREEEAKTILEAVKANRITTQIKPDGSQPHELSRTKSLSYSTMNLRGFTLLAFLGKQIGVDLWHFKAPNGASIKKAFEFLAPYVTGNKTWNYKQINSLSKAEHGLKDLFLMSKTLFGIEMHSHTALNEVCETPPLSLLHFCE